MASVQASMLSEVANIEQSQSLPINQEITPQQMVVAGANNTAAEVVNTEKIKSQPEPNPIEVSSLMQAAEMTNSQVLAWVGEAAMTVFSYDYINLAQHKLQNSRYFTPLAWEKFSQEILFKGDGSGLYDHVVTDKLITKAMPIDVPEVVKQSIIDTTPAWVVQLPVVIIKTNGVQKDRQYYNVSMTILATTKQSSSAGLVIDEMSLVPIDKPFNM